MRVMRTTLAAFGLMLLAMSAAQAANCVDVSPPPGTIIADDGAGSCGPINRTGNALQVTGTITPSGTSDVNLKQVNGTTVTVGAGTGAAGTQRVTTSTDSTIGTITTVTSATVVQPTAASLNATVVGTGTFATQAAQAPSSASTAGVAPVQSSAVETGHVIKASAGNLYNFNVSADSTLSAVAWAVMIFNSTTVPAAGAVTPVKCYLAPIGTTSISGDFAIPLYLGTGISMAVSSGQTCFTKTDSAHGFISANAQ